MRQLVRMAETRQMERWNHTASIVAKLHNVHCTKASQMKGMEDFHPMLAQRKSQKIPITAETIDFLKMLLPADKRR